MNISQAPQQNSQIHPDNVRASLGFSTFLLDHLNKHNQEQMLAQQQPLQAPQTQTAAPQEAKSEEMAKEPPKEEKDPIEAKMTEMELSFTKQLDQIRKEMKDDQIKEMEGLKTMITSALAEEDANEPPKTS